MNTPQDALNIVVNVCRKALLSADERDLCTRALEVIAGRMNRAHELEQAAAEPAPVPEGPAPTTAPSPSLKKQVEEAIATANAAAKRLAELTAAAEPAPVPVAPPES